MKVSRLFKLKERKVLLSYEVRLRKILTVRNAGEKGGFPILKQVEKIGALLREREGERGKGGGGGKENDARYSFLFTLHLAISPIANRRSRRSRRSKRQAKKNEFVIFFGGFFLIWVWVWVIVRGYPERSS